VPELSNNEIIGRVRYASEWLKMFRQSDLTASNQYIDANGSTYGDDMGWDDERGDPFRDIADVPDVVPIGQPNYMAINLEISAAALSSQTPKLHIRADEAPDGFPNSPAIVQQAWQQTWVNGGFKRNMRAAWIKRKICGLGCLWYRWDENHGFVIEHVTSNRFFFDPHCTDLSLRRVRYAGVAINMPVSEAIRRYDPDAEHDWFTVSDNDPDAGPPDGAFKRALSRIKEAFSFTGSGESDANGYASQEKTTCRIYIYFDIDREVHIYNDQIVLDKKNLYGKVPLLFKGLFIDPRDRILPLGMNVFARGLNQALVWLSQIAWNTAKNGAPITFFDTNIIKGPERTALENGSASQMVGVGTPLNKDRPPVIRIPGEQLPPAFGTARMDNQVALDSIMGASSGMRGETPAGVTATAAMLSESKSNAMMVDEQFEFEEWCSDVATAFVMCTQKFGGPEKGKDTPTEVKLLWHAFMAVKSIGVVTGSTSFSNPATELQASMQLYTTVNQSIEGWLGLAAKGLVTKIPNVEAIFEDMLIAFNRTNTDLYWKPAPPPPQGPSTLPPDIVKWMQSNYDGAPEDVKRQIEQAVGLKPSQMPVQQDDGGAAAGQQTALLQARMEALRMQHQTAEHQQDQVHDYRMKALDTASQIAIQQHRAATTPPKTPANGAASRKKP
jgi:hypothetical protein